MKRPTVSVTVRDEERKKPAFYAKMDKVLDGAGTATAKAARIRRMIEGVK